jgi:hypothetical protein
MALTTDEMIRILRDAANDKPGEETGEAAEFRRRMDEEVAEIRKAGGIVEIPSEWEVE